MGTGTKKRGPGRPATGKKVERVTVCLPPWLHDWVSQHPEGLTGLTRRLLLHEYAKWEADAEPAKRREP